MKKIILTTAILFLCLFNFVYSNGLTLNSIGTASFGMGGACLGLANDYSAAYWNPAGIAQLNETEIALSFNTNKPNSTYKLNIFSEYGEALPGVNATSKSAMSISPSINFFMPFLKGKLTAGIGIFKPSNIITEWDGSDIKEISGSNVYNWKSSIGVYQISPTVAYNYHDILFIGAALNLDKGSCELNMPLPFKNSFSQYSETSSGWGTGITLGILYKHSEILSIGLSFKTKNSIKFSGSATFDSLATQSSGFDRDIAWPMWFGAGFAFNPAPDITLCADVHYSQWSKTENKLISKYSETGWDSVTALMNRKFVLNWQDALQIKVGVVYQVNENITARIGYYNEPATAPENTVNILFPSFSYNAFTAGGSYKIGNIKFELGAEYLSGKERTSTDASNIKTLDLKAYNDKINLPGNQTSSVIGFSFGVTYHIKAKQ
ncbi:MAG: outer membrane protein transport protein [Candidatus Kapabacteria bacterium]|nr:outer membrane protein transport protein [Candidatus Kapabacteria bacterium]